MGTKRIAVAASDGGFGNMASVSPSRKVHEDRRGPFDTQLYRLRARVEHLINRLKQFRRIATRYEKRADNYLGMVTIGAILLWL